MAMGLNITEKSSYPAIQPERPPRETWRRWASGTAIHHEPSLPVGSQLAVVVIGFQAQPGLADAVTSLLTQDATPEIVVVNSGGGNAASQLKPFADRIRIIDIEQPLRVGAARNIGIDASEAPYVAFLAGDCRALPGWVSARLRAHDKGACAVASAIEVPERACAASIAAHLTLFGLRSPQVPSPQALRYGVSYAREVFNAHGYFNTAIRIAEDSEFSQRLGRQIFAIWAPDILTEHKNPRTALHLASDMFRRGVRAARRNDPAGGDRSASACFKQAVASARHRYAVASHIGRDIIGLEEWDFKRVQPYLALASLAYALGLTRGAARFHAASKRAAEAAKFEGGLAGHRTIQLLEKAVTLDPENVWFRLLCAEAHLAQGSARAQTHIDHAIELSAYRHDNAEKLMDWLTERELADHAARLAELVSYSLPAAKGHSPPDADR